MTLGALAVAAALTAGGPPVDIAPGPPGGVPPGLAERGLPATSRAAEHSPVLGPPAPPAPAPEPVAEPPAPSPAEPAGPGPAEPAGGTATAAAAAPAAVPQEPATPVSTSPPAPPPASPASPAAPLRRVGIIDAVRARAPAAPRSPGRQAPPAAVAGRPVREVAPASPRPAARPPAERAARTAQARPGEPERPRTVTRTFTRLVSLVPPGVWLAIGGLVLAGLLLALAAAIQTVRRRRLDRTRRDLVADVGLLQSAVLPGLPETIGAAAVSAAYRPAEGLAAGGDFFDAFELPGGRTAVIVGDIAGHGREVVPLTASVRYGLRAYLEAGLEPRSVLQVAGGALAGQLAGCHVTVVVAVFDPGTGRLTYACAGHWPPLLLGVPGAPVTACSSPPLGVGLRTGGRQTTVPLGPGVRAWFFTDGLSDVVGGAGRWGIDGLRRFLTAQDPAITAPELLERVVAASDAQPDDMAACVLRPTSAAAADGVRVEELEVDARAIASGRAERFLRACGAGVDDAARALQTAAVLADRNGAAVLVVAVGIDGADVSVRAPTATRLRGVSGPRAVPSEHVWELSAASA